MLEMKDTFTLLLFAAFLAIVESSEPGETAKPREPGGTVSRRLLMNWRTTECGASQFLVLSCKSSRYRSLAVAARKSLLSRARKQAVPYANFWKQVLAALVVRAAPCSLLSESPPKKSARAAYSIAVRVPAHPLRLAWELS